MLKINASSVNRLRACVAAGLSSTVILLAGCGIGSVATPEDAHNVAINGLVHGGEQAVGGATVALFATTTPASGSAGYGGTVTELASTTTDPTAGTFNFSGTTYTCPAGHYAYLVATGGNPGISSGTDNSAIFLVAALGLCDNLSSYPLTVINEVTTVAAAYALNGFAPAGGVGMTEAAVKGGAASTMPGFTTSTGNTQGLADAFANAANIVNSASGQAYTTAGGTNANSTVPVNIINALADILQVCVNATGPTASTCPTLFTDTTPPGSTTIPVNVFQAALNIARYPGNNVSGLYNLLTSKAQDFTTGLSAQPNDWTVGISYTNSNLTSGTGLGISSNDTVYVSGTGYLLNFNAQGSPISGSNLISGFYSGTSTPSLTSADSLREIAFDKSGNLYMTDGAYTGVYEYKPGTTPSMAALNFDVAPASEANNNTSAVAVDANNDVWTSSYSKSSCSTVTCPLIEFPATATAAPTAYAAYAPFSAFPVSTGSSTTVTAPQPSGAVGGSRGIAFDVNTGNIWVTTIDDASVEVFPVTAGTSGVATAAAGPITQTGVGTEVAAPTSKTACGTISVAMGLSNTAWVVNAGGTSSNCGATTAAAIYPLTLSGTTITKGSAVTSSGLSAPTQVVVDGSNNLFIANTSASSVVEYSPASSSFLSPTGGFIPNVTSTATTFPLYQPSYIAIDKSGAIWALSSGNGTTHPASLVQILGVAAPTDPVLADGNYGTKP